MKKMILMSLSLLLMLVAHLGYAESAQNKETPSNLHYGGKTMLLNGAGLRKKFFLSLYVGSLYLTEKSIDGDAIIESDQPMAIRLFIKSSLITGDKMKESTLKGFKQSGEPLTMIQTYIDTLIEVFGEEGVSQGDIYELIYIPGSGVHVVKNKKRLVVIRSLEFKKALFGIWLSKKPVQQSLKRQMLGI